MKKFISILAGLIFSLTITAQDLMTIGEVFDYSIGDEFHISGFADGQPPNADRIKIIDKYYSANNDSLFYIRNHDSYHTTILMEPPYLEYHFWTVIDTVFYTNLDSSITHYKYWTSYDTTMVKYDTINHISEEYCDSLVNGYDCEIGEFEPIYYVGLYGKGLGRVKDYYYQPAEYSGFNNVLFYYKKNGVSCGTPDTTTVSVSEIIINPEIKIYPNPTEKYFTIDFKTNGQSNLKIYNAGGKLLISQTIEEKSNYINCSSLTTGFYVICVSSESNEYYEKLIIK
jgi:hypothetical protein